jgi:hypothetical protein
MFRKRRPQPADTLHPHVWLTQPDGAVRTEALERGSPRALAWWQRRRDNGPRMHAQPFPQLLQSRPYSRGAQAYSPKFGYLPFNPIGAGVVAQNKIQAITGPGGRYEFGAIFWRVNNVPGSIEINPTVPVEVVDALIANGSVGGFTPTTG